MRDSETESVSETRDDSPARWPVGHNGKGINVTEVNRTLSQEISFSRFGQGCGIGAEFTSSGSRYSCRLNRPRHMVHRQGNRFSQGSAGAVSIGQAHLAALAQDGRGGTRADER